MKPTGHVSSMIRVNRSTQIIVIYLTSGIVLTLFDLLMGNSNGLRWSYWVWLIGSGLSAIPYFYRNTNLRHLWKSQKHQVVLYIAFTISLILSYYKYKLDGLFTDEMDTFAERLGEHLFQPGFLSWFQDYESKHKYRIIYPLLMALIAKITHIEEKTVGVGITIVSVILCMHYISKMCKQRNFSESDRYSVLLIFISNASIIANMARVMTDVIGLLFVIICFYYYYSYLETGCKRALVLSYTALIFAILSREILFLLAIALWLTPNERLNWKKRTLLYLVPAINAIAILFRFISWELIVFLLSPLIYVHDSSSGLVRVWWFIQYTIEIHLDPIFLIKWAESLLYALLIPLLMAIFAIPIRETLRAKFKNRLDLIWFLVYILFLFVIRSARVFGRQLMPISWMFFLLVPEGTSQFIKRTRFENKDRAKKIIIGAIILAGYQIHIIRTLTTQFDLFEKWRDIWG